MIAQVQTKAIGNQSAGTTVTAAFVSNPTPGSVMVACLAGTDLSWQTLSGWTAGAASSLNTDVAIQYRIAQIGDGKTYTFTQNTASDTLGMQLSEWGGFPAGSITVDIMAGNSNGSGTSAIVAGGTSTIATSLVIALVASGGGGLTGGAWDQGITRDSQFTDFTNTTIQIMTGYKITSATQSFTNTTASWTGSHSSNMVIISFGSTGGAAPVTIGAITTMGVPTITAVAPSTPLLIQRITNSNGGVATQQITVTFTGTPTINNLLIACCSALVGGWTAPAGWTLSGAGTGADANENMFYHQVQAGDGKTYVFNLTGGVNSVCNVELDEWTGFPAGTITVDRQSTAEGPTPGLSVSCNPGGTTTPIQLIKAMVGVTGTGATAASWNQGFSVDTAFMNNQMATAHKVTTAPVNLNPITATWTTGSNTSTIVVCSFTVVPLTPVLVQPAVTAFNASATSLPATLANAPVAGNMMVAACVCSTGTGWTAPAGWLIGGVKVGNVNMACFYKRVKAGDAATYTFAIVGSAGKISVALLEFTGIPGTPCAELIGAVDTSGALTASLNLGTTSQAVDLVIGILGLVPTVTAAGGTWTQGLVNDINMLNNQLLVAHLITNVAQTFSPTAVTWTTAAVASTLMMIAFTFVPYQAAISFVWRGSPGFAVGQPAASSGTQYEGIAAGVASNTPTITPGIPQAELLGFAVAVNTIPGAAPTLAITGGTQDVTVATTGPGLNVALTINEGKLAVSAPTTWTFAGATAYSGMGNLLALQ